MTAGFKIAQFADLHFGEAEDTLWGPLQDVNSTRVMERVLAWESPKLVVYSGDQVTGENINSNATAYWGRLLQPCVSTDTPWATVFGNHDDRSVSGGTRIDLLTFDKSFNLSLSQFGPVSTSLTDTSIPSLSPSPLHSLERCTWPYQLLSSAVLQR
ncbi:Probable inactive purple acid phosphatase 16 [Geodia barretti]|uniref:Probable inactive purple acid phosphatase 16 n=1 Tax=Geodia barretti TaxID=519541 RepID=A0AA35W6N0_GEOBA|nr:Probable inactive purple acid phosphatase 16 [Geodia barretti]